jgi:hypothetical protein
MKIISQCFLPSSQVKESCLLFALAHEPKLQYTEPAMPQCLMAEAAGHVNTVTFICVGEQLKYWAALWSSSQCCHASKNIASDGWIERQIQ